MAEVGAPRMEDAQEVVSVGERPGRNLLEDLGVCPPMKCLGTFQVPTAKAPPAAHM